MRVDSHISADIARRLSTQTGEAFTSSIWVDVVSDRRGRLLEPVRFVMASPADDGGLTLVPTPVVFDRFGSGTIKHPKADLALQPLEVTAFNDAITSATSLAVEGYHTADLGVSL